MALAGRRSVCPSVCCLWLHRKHKTLGEIVELPAGTEKNGACRQGSPSDSGLHGAGAGGQGNVCPLACFKTARLLEPYCPGQFHGGCEVCANLSRRVGI